MSHQTGIHANDELKKFFALAKKGKIRIFKVIIDKEELLLDYKQPVDNDFKNDYEKFILPLIEEDIPCYILYRLDSKNDSNYNWLFISWSPDTAPIRQKMLYASTKATLKQEFGSSLIKEDMHCTVKSDITLNGYYKFKNNAKAPAPLTSREEELQELKKSEVHTDYNVDSKQETLRFPTLPVTDYFKTCVDKMLNGTFDYILFRIDTTSEKIDATDGGHIGVDFDKLQSKIPSSGGAYHLYKFKHQHEGDYLDTIVFIYSMIAQNATMKERILYTTSKNSFLTTLSSLGLEVETKVEIFSSQDLTEQFLYEEIHPIKCLHRPQFAKPKGPPNRGPKRITKSQKS